LSLSSRQPHKMDIFKKLKLLEYYPLSAKPIYLIRLVQTMIWMDEGKENKPKKDNKSLCFIIYHMMSLDSEDIDTTGIDVVLTQFGGFKSNIEFVCEYLKLPEPFRLDFEPIDYYNTHGEIQFMLYYGIDSMDHQDWAYEGDSNVVSRISSLLKFFSSLDIIIHSRERPMLCNFKQINDGLYHTDQMCAKNFMNDISIHLAYLEMMYLDLINCNARYRSAGLDNNPLTRKDKRMMKRFIVFFKKQVRAAVVPLNLYLNWSH